MHQVRYPHLEVCNLHEEHQGFYGIYAAGEEAIEGVNSHRIAEGVKEFGHKNVEYIGVSESVIPHLQKILKPGDIVMTLGAGNIGELSHKLASHFND